MLEGLRPLTAIACPHCGSAATLPLPGLGDRLSAVFGAAFARRGNDLTFNNPELAQKFNTGECGAYCRNCRKRFTRQTKPDEAPTASPAPLASRTTADRLRELEQLRVEGLITDDEYNAKRAHILADL